MSYSSLVTMVLHDDRPHSAETCSRLRYMSHTAAICRNTPIHSFTADGRNWTDPYGPTLKQVMFLRKYREKQLFVGTAFWQKVYLWPNCVVMWECEFDEVCGLGQTAVAVTVCEETLRSVPSVYRARDKVTQNTRLCRLQSSMRNRWEVEKNNNYRWNRNTLFRWIIPVVLISILNKSLCTSSTTNL